MATPSGGPRRGLAFQARLFGGGLVLLVVAASAAIVLSELQLRDAAAAADRAHEAQLVIVGFGQTLDEANADLARYAVTGDQGALDAFTADDAAFQSSRSALETYAGQPTLAPTLPRLVAEADRWHDWARAAQATLAAGGSVDFNQAAALKAAFDSDSMVARARTQLASLAAADTITALSTRIVAVTVLASAVGVTGVLALLGILFNSTLRPITRLSNAAAELAQGRAVTIGSPGGSAELRELAAALESWRSATHVRLRMAESTAVIGDPFTIERVLETSAGALAEGLGARHVSYTLIAPDGRRLLAAIYSGSVLRTVAERMHPEGSPSRVVVETGRPLLTDLRDTRWPERVRQYAVDEGLGPAMVVPLRSTGRALGVVSLTRDAGSPVFTSADTEAIQLVLPSLAAAVHVAQLLGELRAANQHKTEFVAHMSHELRTPLNSVLGFAQLLADDRMGTLTDRQTRYVDHILSSGSHLLSLINDVLDLARVEAGQLALEPETVALWRVLAGCVAKVRPAADAKNIDLDCSVDHHLAVIADRRRLVQIVFNLLSNAVKFTPERGRIDVCAKADGAGVVITVRDSGIGIAAEDQARVFDAFVQVGEGRTRDQDGTGLGLRLSRGLAEEMGGTLTLESQLGRGSSFHLRLPAAAAAPEQPAAAGR